MELPITFISFRELVVELKRIVLTEYRQIRNWEDITRQSTFDELYELMGELCPWIKFRLDMQIGNEQRFRRFMYLLSDTWEIVQKDEEFQILLNVLLYGYEPVEPITWENPYINPNHSIKFMVRGE